MAMLNETYECLVGTGEIMTYSLHSHKIVRLVLVIEHRLKSHIQDPLRNVELGLVLVPHLPSQLGLFLVGLDGRRLRQRRAFLGQTLLLFASGVKTRGA